MATVAAPDLETSSAEEVLAYAVEQYHPRLYLACSFQKEESVLIDMLHRIKAREQPQARLCWHCNKPLHARSSRCPFCGENQ